MEGQARGYGVVLQIYGQNHAQQQLQPPSKAQIVAGHFQLLCELQSSRRSPKESSRSMRSGLECTAVLKPLTALMAFRNLRLALVMFCRHRGGMAAAQHEVPVEGGCRPAGVARLADASRQQCRLQAR